MLHPTSPLVTALILAEPFITFLCDLFTCHAGIFLQKFLDMFLEIPTDGLHGTLVCPPYSGTIRSITPRRFRSSDVIFMTSLASLALSASFHNIEAKPSGDRIEYVAFSIIHTSLPTAVASAPPLPPSPIRMHNTGTFKADISSRFRAMASPWPLSSASTPQKAPACLQS